LRRVTTGLVVALTLGGSMSAHAGGDSDRGKARSAVCAHCHGADGNSTNGLWPKLAGQHELYLVKQLEDFRSGARKDPAMNAMAQPLSDADIANLAAFYASQKQK